MTLSRPWRVEAIYTLGIWLPLLLPVAFAVPGYWFGTAFAHTDLGKLSQVVLGSLLYGGIPYSLLAIWATWWIRRKPESTIRYVMFRAPFLMAALFFLMAAVVGEIVDARTQFLAVGVLGVIVTIPLGYFYVFCVVLMREELGP